jgi:hypothetical protein
MLPSIASADGTPSLDLPPGIEKQALILIAEHMQRMQEMGMSHDMQMMMKHLQNLADRLPPGIFLQFLRLINQLEKPEMMILHQQVHHGDLLDQPPGQVLTFVQELAG